MKTKRELELEKRKIKELRDKTIRAMLSDDTITYQEIADMVGVSIKTVKRHAIKNNQQRYRSTRSDRWQYLMSW